MKKTQEALQKKETQILKEYTDEFKAITQKKMENIALLVTLLIELILKI